MSLSAPTLSICLAVWGKWIYEFLIFAIFALIIFFIFSIYNTVGQQVDQKYTATFSKKNSKNKLALLDLKIMRPHLHNKRGQFQSIQPCLFNPFNTNKILFLVCSNTSKPLVSHYVPFNYFFFQKMLNTKQLGDINDHHIKSTI